MSGIFKAYDIRGSYPVELDEQTAGDIAAAFVSYLKAGRIVVGRDMRLSSPALAEAFMESAVRSGASVTDIGLVTTPLLYDAVIEGGFGGGAMVTASHLPAKMNGLKLCREQAIPLSMRNGLPEIEHRVREGIPVNKGEKKGTRRKSTHLADYIEKLSRFVHQPGPLNAAVDAGNGAVGPEVRLLFGKFPVWKVHTLYMEPDGRFPHHVANPLIPSNTQDLQRAVIREGADIGVAFDGDADRCGFVDEKGERVPADLITALIAEFLLTKEPGAAILYDLRSSRIVPETIARLGGRPVRSRVGHSFIKEAMRQENALFAGELSGHYYYRDTGFTDNALFTMIQMFNFLSLKDKTPLSQLIAPLRVYAQTGEINLEVKNKEGIFSALESGYGGAEIDRLDGLTVAYEDWWFNLRSSNTEPVMRLNLEAKDRPLMEEKRKEVLLAIRRADPTAVRKA